MQAAVVKAFQRIYHRAARRTWHDVWYRGTRLHAYPTDLWVYQELLEELKPGLVVQTGTYRGGTALFLADRLQIIGRGQVVTIDAEAEANRPQHPRLTYLTGPPTAADIVDEVRGRLDASEPALLLLGAGTTKDEVLAELESYAPLAPAGSVVVVEHTHLDGPAAALQEFLGTTSDFEVDARGDRHFLTQNPGGVLRRVAGRERRRRRGRRPPPSISTRPPPAVRTLEPLTFDGAEPHGRAGAAGLRTAGLLRRHQDRRAGRGPARRRARARSPGHRRPAGPGQHPRRGVGGAGRDRARSRPARGRRLAPAEHADVAGPGRPHDRRRLGGDVLDHRLGPEDPGPRRPGHGGPGRLPHPGLRARLLPLGPALRQGLLHLRRRLPAAGQLRLAREVRRRRLPHHPRRRLRARPRPRAAARRRREVATRARRRGAGALLRPPRQAAQHVRRRAGGPAAVGRAAARRPDRRGAVRGRGDRRRGGPRARAPGSSCSASSATTATTTCSPTAMSDSR